MRILVVEDSAAQAAFLKKLLEDLGHRVHTCHTAIDAVKSLAVAAYDAMVTDWYLPCMTAGEMFDLMDKTPGAHRPPVIVVTAAANGKLAAAEADSVRWGVKRVIHKPFSISEVEESVRSVAQTEQIGPLPGK